jgi:uncharacterized protein YcaQ
MRSAPALPRRRERLGAAEARRVALGATGLAGARPDAAAGARQLRAMVERLGVVQIDSVNVLQRAHYLPGFSRLGPYPVEALDRLAHYAPRRLFEYWGHEASLLPVRLQPHLRWRMDRAAHDAWGGMRRVQEERPELVARVLEHVRERGPISASEIAAEEEADVPRRTGPWWDWSEVKRAIEFLFWSGQVTSARRRGFERLYDVPERVIPKAVLDTPTPPVDEAQRELVRTAARAFGVATERDLRDYFRLPVAEARARVAELAEAGELMPVAVDGWRETAYLHRDATIPRRARAAALVGPFDPLIWERPRVERLFGFRYRIEIYVPAPQRVHGYYVLPFLLGDALVARVDLKADRQAGALLVQAAHAEPDAPAATAEALRAELATMAAWLGLDGVSVQPRGDLAPALASSA